jgi:chitinase
MPVIDLAVRALALNGALNGYWGQKGFEDLKTHCDSGIDYVTVSFVNRAPEWDKGTNYPGTNFAGHCSAETYDVNGKKSGLQSDCWQIQQGIPYCRSKGVKVLLAIGGEYNTGLSNYNVTTEANGKYFAEFLYNAFGPYNSSWTGPRPFDLDADTHTQVDGFDFDIELPGNYDVKPYIAMADTLRRLGPSLYLTAAPQCRPGDRLEELISKASLDAIFVQFYNNGNANCNIDTTGIINYDHWAGVVSKSAKSKNAKIFIGVPASKSGGAGYVDPAKLKENVCWWKSQSSNFGGISLWDISLGLDNKPSGKTYNQHAKEILAGSCPTPTKPGNGIATPGPTQPNMNKNCNKFYYVKSGENCAAMAAKHGLSFNRLKSWNPSIGDNCLNLEAKTYVCVNVVGYTPTPTTTCGSTAKSWGDNKDDALSRAKRWCSGNGGSLTYTVGQRKNGCYNALKGENKYQFSIQNNWGIQVSMATDKCEMLMKEAINKCSKGGTGLIESWWYKAEVVGGKC